MKEKMIIKALEELIEVVDDLAEQLNPHSQYKIKSANQLKLNSIKQTLKSLINIQK